MKPPSRHYEALKPIRVMYDNGAGGQSPGTSLLPPTKNRSTASRSRAPKPAPGTSHPRAPWPPARHPAPHADEFTWDAHALPPTDFTGDTGSGEGGLWTATPGYEWEQSPPGSAVSYVTAPLASDTTVIGAGAVNVWVRSSTPNVDLQATVSEVRPDGIETFVQNGWVRGNERALDAEKSTPLEPVLSLRESDVSPLPADRFVKVTIPLYYEGHVYRAGSRIRVTIAAPNGTQPIWAFARTEPEGTANVAIAYGKDQPSNLLLPIVPSQSAPTALPPCPGLRGEPCREYQPLANRTASPSGQVESPAPTEARQAPAPPADKQPAGKAGSLRRDSGLSVTVKATHRTLRILGRIDVDASGRITASVIPSGARAKALQLSVRRNGARFSARRALPRGRWRVLVRFQPDPSSDWNAASVSRSLSLR